MNGEVNIRLTNRALLVVLFALGFVWLLLHATRIFVILFIAILLAASVSTAAERLSRWRIRRGVAILLLYLAIVAVLGGVVSLLIPLILGEVKLLQRNLPAYETAANRLLARLPTRDGTPPQVNDLINAVAGQLQAAALDLSKGALAFGSTLVTLLLIFVIAYFLAVDERFAQRVVTRFFPPHPRARAVSIMGKIGRGLGHWVRAQLLLAAFFGVFFGLGLLLLGVPYALTLGTVGGILEIIPYVGGLLTVVLAVLVAATTGKLWLIVAAVVWYTIVVNLEAHIVAPKLVGEIVGLHPLVVVLALFLGAEFLGILGALLAVPVAVIAQVFLDEFWIFPDSEAPAMAQPTGAARTTHAPTSTPASDNG